MGENVVILGGGNVAFDCARTAVRLGASKVDLACLEDKPNMLADEEEISQAAEEGVEIHPSSTFERICGTKKVRGVEFCKVKKFSFDENHRAVIEKDQDSSYVIEADTVIFAVGQRPAIGEEAGLTLGRGNSIVVNENTHKTSAEGVFACGDVIYGTKTVIAAVDSGRQAASEIDRFLGGSGDISEVLVPREKDEPGIGKVENFGDLGRAEEEILLSKERQNSFVPVSGGICDSDICKEAGRCLQCDLRFDIHKDRLWSDYSEQEMEEVR